MLAAPFAEARITRVEITGIERPAFGGYSWPGVGQYEKIVGKAYGEVDPTDPKNSLIVDIGLAPRNARGNVEYAHNFYILKPVDLSRGAHKVMYEPPNRGNKTWNAFGRVSSGPGGQNDPGSIVDPAVLEKSFLMPRGYTMVWSGWEHLGSLDGLTGSAELPIARNSDGSSITGPSYEYIVTGAASVNLSYPAADLDKSKARLTHRVHLNDPPRFLDPSEWNYNAEGTAISLAGGNFIANDIYEFAYTAKDPRVNGLGFAAVRDFVAWLRYESRDDFGNPNPLAGDIQRIYTEVVSQPGRLLNDFRHFGFNQAENGRKVFDGHMQWIAAGNGLNMNYRFSQSGRTERNRQNHLFIEGRFPFLDHRLFAFASALPGRSRLRGMKEKHILHRWARQHLSAELPRRAKQPYRAPDAAAFFNASAPPAYRDELLDAQALKAYGWFEPAAVQGLVRRCMAGRATGFLENQALVGILSTQLWHQQFFTRPHAVTPLPAEGADVVLGSAVHALPIGDRR